jgi:hypothetical protein
MLIVVLSVIMLSVIYVVANKPLKLSVIMLNVVYAECRKKALRVIMLNVIMKNVVAREIFAKDKHSSLFCPFVCYKVNRRAYDLRFILKTFLSFTWKNFQEIF